MNPADMELQRAIKLALTGTPAIAEHIAPERIRTGFARPDETPVVILEPTRLEILGRAAGNQAVAEASTRLHIWCGANQPAIAHQIANAATLALLDAPRVGGAQVDEWERPALVWVPDPDPAYSFAHAVISLNAVLRWRVN